MSCIEKGQWIVAESVYGDAVEFLESGVDEYHVVHIRCEDPEYVRGLLSEFYEPAFNLAGALFRPTLSNGVVDPVSQEFVLFCPSPFL